jgi:hypothetical protein
LVGTTDARVGAGGNASEEVKVVKNAVASLLSEALGNPCIDEINLLFC